MQIGTSIASVKESFRLTHQGYEGSQKAMTVPCWTCLGEQMSSSRELPLTFPARLETTERYCFQVSYTPQASSFQCSFDAPRIFLWPVAVLMDPHLSFLLTVSQGYKHYQAKSIFPRFAFGCVDFGTFWFSFPIASQTRVILYNLPIFGSRSFRTKHKRE